MVRSQIGDMVYVMNTMLDNMARLLEEMRSLQKDIQNKLDDVKEEPQEQTRNLKQHRRLQKPRTLVVGK